MTSHDVLLEAVENLKIRIVIVADRPPRRRLLARVRLRHIAEMTFRTTRAIIAFSVRALVGFCHYSYDGDARDRTDRLGQEKRFYLGNIFERSVEKYLYVRRRLSYIVLLAELQLELAQRVFRETLLFDRSYDV
jgi:hypothetical protein